MATVMLLAVLLAGCSLISTNNEIRGILKDAGVEPEGVNIETTNGHTRLTVGYRTAAPDVAGALPESRRVAEALWRRAPVGFDELRLEPSGASGLDHITLSTADLENEFGPRPEGAGGDLTGGLLRDLAVLAVAGLLVLIGLAVLIAVLVRRSRRRRREQSAPPWPGPGGYPPQQQQGWPGQQPPGSWPPSPPPGPGRR